MKTVYQKPDIFLSENMHYCPGCTHGVAHRLVAEAIDELGAKDRAIGVASVGCSVFAANYLDCDFTEAAHGRAPAVATGVKRVHPEALVFAYQGDGDLASIGVAEIIHAAARGENITVIFINNAIYGMTGGQMAPTTLVDQVTTTSPSSRKPESAGYPIRMSEIIATLDGTAYVERAAMYDVPSIVRAKKAVKKAFEMQVNKKGFAMVELLSTCPTNWGMSPVDSMRWLKDNMIPKFPLGVFKEV